MPYQLKLTESYASSPPRSAAALLIPILIYAVSFPRLDSMAHAQARKR